MDSWLHVQRGALNRDQAATAFRFVLRNLPSSRNPEVVSEDARELAVAHA